MQQVTRKKLGEGVALTCVTTPRFKRAVLRVMLLLPLGGAEAACRACLPQVLRRGTAKLPDLRAIGETLDERYGARIEGVVRKEGETLCIGFLADCIDEAYAPGADGLTASVIALLADLLYDPCLQDGVFRAADVEGERGALLDRIAAQKNDPRLWAPRRLTELMCADEPYGLSALGTAEQAARIGAERLYAAYRRALDEAQIELFYCGTRPPDEIERLFGATPLTRRRTAVRPLPQARIVARPVGAPREVIEQAAVAQAKLSLGFRTGGHCLTGGDPAAYWLFQTVFGGSTSSKLFLNVREKQSLCYYASAQFAASKGILMVHSGIENDKFATARDEILRQLDACRAGEMTDGELEAARRSLVNGWRTLLDDPLALERYWLSQAASGTLVAPEERIAQVQAVERAQVVQAAQDTALDLVYLMEGTAG